MRIRRHWFTGLVSLAVIVFLWAPLAIVAVNSVNGNPLLARWGENRVDPESSTLAG